MNQHHEREFWKLLEKEQLADLSRFHRPGSFDEVPLFSREADIDFLRDDPQVNEVCLRFALKFLSAVLTYEHHRTGYFAAITVWGPAEFLVPNLFFWCGDVRELEKKLVLSEATKPFAKQMKKLVAKLQLGEKFILREDTATLADETRVFIAPEHLPD